MLQYSHMKWNWDYDIPDNWKPTTDLEWEWFLVRKINYGDYNVLHKEAIRKYFTRIRKKLDPGKARMLEHFLQT